MIQARLFTEEQTQTTSDDYYTPKWIFETLGLHFDLDVASPPHATNVPCDRYYTQVDDGLAQEWHGRVWMNPPFSNPTPWINRWLDHGNGVAVLIISKSNAFRRLWNDERVKIAYLADHNMCGVKFLRNGVKNQIKYPVCIAAVGADNIETLHKFGNVR